MACLRINDTFTSYIKLREAIDRYESENRVQFWKRDAKKIQSAQQYAPQIYETAKKHPELEYYYLKFACIHGGQAFRPNISSCGRRRRNRGTWKQDCKAEVSISLTKDRTALIVNNIISEHNHPIPSLEEYKQLPKQRRKFEEETMRKKERLKKIKEKKRSQSEAKNSVLKNILKTNSSSRSNNFKKIAKYLEEKYSCEVCLLTDMEDKVIGFFFQDPHMKTSFDYFPEVLYIDAMYRLQNINCSVYILCVENSFGTTDVIAITVLTMDGRDSVQWMLEKFKETNPSWEEIKVVVTDKFISEYYLIQEHLPDACRLMCQSHTFQIIKKEVRSLQLDVTFTERQTFLHYVERLMYCSSEEDYTKILEEMEEHLPYLITEYFYKNWHELRSEWAKAFSKKHRLLINCKLESPNSKLKSVISPCKNFQEFIEKLFTVLNIKRTDFKNEFTKTLLKKPKTDKLNRSWVGFQKQLTFFAFTKIEPFLKCEKQYALKQEGLTMVCETKKKTLFLTSCNFYTFVKLPCKHVLFYRKTLDIELYDEDLFAEKWTKKYIKCAFEKLLMSDHGFTENEEISSEKIREVHSVCSTLATLCTETIGKEFINRLNLLIELKNCWENGESVGIFPNKVKHFNIISDINDGLNYNNFIANN